MDEHYKKLSSLQANVTRETFQSQLGETDTATGTIALLPGKGRNFYLRLDWEKPRAENIAVVNGEYTAYNPSIKQAWVGSSGSKTLNDKGGNALQVMSMSREEIKANYTVEYLGQESVSGGIPTWHLKLTPKTKSNYKFVDLWVDGNGMPLQGKITQPNNDTDSILLRNLKKNETIDGSRFVIKLPKGTKIVKG
jgi:outer membrane lipoprotein-sorting protein